MYSVCVYMSTACQWSPQLLSQLLIHFMYHLLKLKLEIPHEHSCVGSDCNKQPWIMSIIDQQCPEQRLRVTDHKGDI